MATELKKVFEAENQTKLLLEIKGKQQTLTGSHLLVAAGRKANIEGLNLTEAGVKTFERGIIVNSKLKSSNKRIFAMGDAAGAYQFTHIASYHAGIIIRNALFHLPAKVNYTAVPWVTYTNPELAHVGMTEEEAKKYDVNNHTITDNSENIVAYINTHLRLLEANFQIFPGSTRNAHRSKTPKILREIAINIARYTKYQKS